MSELECCLGIALFLPHPITAKNDSDTGRVDDGRSDHQCSNWLFLNELLQGALHVMGFRPNLFHVVGGFVTPVTEVVSDGMRDSRSVLPKSGHSSRPPLATTVSRRSM